MARVDSLQKGRFRPTGPLQRQIWGFLKPSQRPRRLAGPRTPPFHGDNTGSNPVGDANKTNNLEKIDPKPEGLKGFDKKKPISGFIFVLLLFPHDLPRYAAVSRAFYIR